MLADIMQLSFLTKEQLIELCNALYALLESKQSVAPAFTFIPQQVPSAPAGPFYNDSPWNSPKYPIITCNSGDEQCTGKAVVEGYTEHNGN